MLKCLFCEAQTRYIGEPEIDLGWQRLEGIVEGEEVDLICCPLHIKEFYKEVPEFLMARAIQRIRRRP